VLGREWVWGYNGLARILLYVLHGGGKGKRENCKKALQKEIHVTAKSVSN
jgi:hypothetical protein